VITTKVAQEQVANFVNENNVDVVLVRSATKVRKDIIDACPGLKIIGRGGVEWIILRWIMRKGITVINTSSSSESVAELVLPIYFLACVSCTFRTMPLEGDSNFDGLKAYANGIELRGKTLGIVGIGRIGRRLQRWLSA
jgi:D-3-phosphoglycerate dehydrogenase